MVLFDLLPACHYACATSYLDIPPHPVEILVVDYADVACVGGEDGEIVAAEGVFVIRHCIAEASDNGFRHS